MDTPVKPGRNEPCHCGSKKKYKQCCLAQDEVAAREARAKAQASAAAAQAAAPPEDEAPSRGKPHGRTEHGPANDRAKSRGFKKTAGVRKVGGG